MLFPLDLILSFRPLFRNKNWITIPLWFLDRSVSCGLQYDVFVKNQELQLYQSNQYIASKLLLAEIKWKLDQAKIVSDENIWVMVEIINSGGGGPIFCIPVLLAIFDQYKKISRSGIYSGFRPQNFRFRICKVIKNFHNA